MMKTVTLNNGIKMPILGFGVFQIYDKTECERSILDALEIGYRQIDTAASYQNEVAVGKAIRASGLPREEVFVTSKLLIQDTGVEKTKAAFEKSLKRLNVDYIDLYLIHQPFGNVHGSWQAMEELYKEGKTRAIGVSNFQSDRVMDLICFNEITPAINQIETHPFHQQVENQKFLREKDIQLESWGPFAEGKNSLFTNELLRSIGKKYSKSIAQVVIRWLIQREIVAIPKSVNKDRIKENFNVFDFQLSDEDMASIKTLDKKESAFFDHRDPKIIQWMASRKLNI